VRARSTRWKRKERVCERYVRRRGGVLGFSALRRALPEGFPSFSSRKRKESVDFRLALPLAPLNAGATACVKIGRERKGQATTSSPSSETLIQKLRKGKKVVVRSRPANSLASVQRDLAERLKATVRLTIVGGGEADESKRTDWEQRRS
jgi:hypothetical protein